MDPFGRAGLRTLGGARASFAPPTGRALGNDLPANTGLWPSTAYGEKDKPGPGGYDPRTWTGGTAGAGNDGFFGTDPRAAPLQPHPRVWTPQPEGGNRANPAVRPFHQVQQQSARPDDRAPLIGLLPTVNGPAAVARVSDVGIIGWNDQLQVKDHHAYWDRGNQLSGLTPVRGGTGVGSFNDPLVNPPRPDLRTVNRQVNPQQGSDASRNADDLSRPYTWLGQQDGTWSRVWGGAPGLYQPYGSRGGWPFDYVGPEEGTPQDGPQAVWSGPAHGYHSTTLGGRWQSIRRYAATKQMQPVRIDRPSNSPQAGQSYSQLVQHQGAPPRKQAEGYQARTQIIGSRRGWAGWQVSS